MASIPNKKNEKASRNNFEGIDLITDAIVLLGKTMPSSTAPRPYDPGPHIIAHVVKNNEETLYTETNNQLKMMYYTVLSSMGPGALSPPQ